MLFSKLKQSFERVIWRFRLVRLAHDIIRSKQLAERHLHVLTIVDLANIEFCRACYDTKAWYDMVPATETDEIPRRRTTDAADYRS